MTSGFRKFNNKCTYIIMLSIFAFSKSIASVVELGIIADAGRTTSSSKLVRESMIRSGVFNTILPGDNLYSGTYQSVWRPWADAGFSFDLVAIGNHNGGYSSEIKFFNMPSEYYAQVIEGVRFLVLNSDNKTNIQSQISWLEKELSNSTESLIFIVFHHPTYTLSKEHTWDEKKEFQQSIRSTIWKYRSKITALIVGHDHLASLIHFNDLPVILSGAVQEVACFGITDPSKP